MFQSSSTLMSYLIGRGVLSTADVLDDDISIIEAGRRNRNFKVVRRDGSGLFVKQVPVAVSETMQSVQREAALYALAESDGTLANLKALTPHLRHYDSERHILIIDLVADARSLAMIQMQPLGSGTMQELAAQLGTQLAACHTTTLAALSGAVSAGIFPQRVHWIFFLADNGETLMPDMSPGAREILAALRAEPGLQAHMNRLRSEWTRACLIHGDMKWENFLVSAKSGDDRSNKVQLIDWELADIGDPAWDVGCVLASFIQPLIASQSGQGAMAAIPAQLAEAQANCRAFWDAYAGVFAATPQQRAQALMRCVNFAGARLVLSAYEMAQTLPSAPPAAQLAIRSAAAILNDPYSAKRDLFTLDVGH